MCQLDVTFLTGGGRVRDAQEFAQQCRLRVGIVQQKQRVLGIQFELSVVPPARALSDVDGTEQAHVLALVEGALEGCHALVMGLRLGLFDALLLHETDVVSFAQSQRHPEVRIGIELGGLFGELGLVFSAQCRQQCGTDAEAPQRRSNLPDFAKRSQHLNGGGVIDLFHLGCLWNGTIPLGLHDGNDTVLVKPLFRPFFGGRCGVSQQRAHDVGMVRWGVRKRLDRWQEDLISPIDAETAFSGRSVNSSLAHHGFQYSERLAIRSQEWEFHARLVVVLACRQRRQAGSLSRRMVQCRADGAIAELGRQVQPVQVFLGILCRLLPRVQSSQPVAGTGTTPIFTDGNDHREFPFLFRLAQLGHPKVGLVVIGRADDRHIVSVLQLGHCRDGCLQAAADFCLIGC
mmetsp:Transcript_24552/g.68914  ORF Transcript_24552/g.68914 Transcript_24552/m.68914 type:complete len:402 (+) Transcript_24552:490-1695(+)